MIAKLKDILRGRNGEWIGSFSTSEDFRELYDSLKDQEVSIEIKKYSRARSLEANAYCWALIDKIAQATGVKKSEVYRNAIREIGGVSSIVCAQDKAVEKLRSGWEKHGLGWQSEVLDSKIDGCKNVVLYYGSSVYDTAQMSQLINSLIQDAEALGIPTITDAEAERMLGTWSKKISKNESEGNQNGN